jgi:heptosyltransferase-2
MQNNSKILIIQTAFIGDVILTTPLIKGIYDTLSPKVIDFLTIPRSVNIVESNPYLGKTIVFDKQEKDKGVSGLLKLSRLLAKEEYDICFTPHRSWRSAFITKSTGAKIRIGFDRSVRSSVFTHLVKYKPHVHEIERNLSLLHALHVDYNITRPKIYPTNEDIETILQILKDKGISETSNLFAVAPGSIWSTKKWPLQSYQRFCQLQSNRGRIILLLGSQEDTNLCRKIESLCDNCLSLAGKISIRQTRYLLEYCDGLLTNDSAPLHIGLAANIPVFAIFGATTPQFGFAPIGDKDIVFENEILACRPCGIHGGSKCPTRTFACMETITPQEVYEGIESNLYNGVME